MWKFLYKINQVASATLLKYVFGNPRFLTIFFGRIWTSTLVIIKRVSVCRNCAQGVAGSRLHHRLHQPGQGVLCGRAQHPGTAGRAAHRGNGGIHTLGPSRYRGGPPGQSRYTSFLTKWERQTGTIFVQISTRHYPDMGRGHTGAIQIKGSTLGSGQSVTGR
jgi:hypothetical protein